MKISHGGLNLFTRNVSRFLLAGFLPLLLLTIGYVCCDPFMVLRSYSNYSYSKVITDRDYVSTDIFLQNYPKQHYNSFIFGTSRTMSFRPETWRKYLPKDAKPFAFDASCENIFGIYTKLKYLDSTKVPIDNALILLCRDNTFDESSAHTGHLFIKDPRIAGGSKFNFQATFYEAYLNPKFLFSFYWYQIAKTNNPYIEGFMTDEKVRYDTVTNQINVVDREAEIEQNPKLYYSKIANLFYKRNGETTDTVRRILPKHERMLREIGRILSKNKTNYKVVLSPLYEQVKFNPSDYELLQSLFGDRLFDCTGKNKFTEPITNYYETRHFRPNVGEQIFPILYGKK